MVTVFYVARGVRRLYHGCHRQRQDLMYHEE